MAGNLQNNFWNVFRNYKCDRLRDQHSDEAFGLLFHFSYTTEVKSVMHIQPLIQGASEIVRASLNQMLNEGKDWRFVVIVVSLLLIAALISSISQPIYTAVFHI